MDSNGKKIKKLGGTSLQFSAMPAGATKKTMNERANPKQIRAVLLQSAKSGNGASAWILGYACRDGCFATGRGTVVCVAKNRKSAVRWLTAAGKPVWKLPAMWALAENRLRRGYEATAAEIFGKCKKAGFDASPALPPWLADGNGG